MSHHEEKDGKQSMTWDFGLVSIGLYGESLRSLPTIFFKDQLYIACTFSFRIELYNALLFVFRPFGKSRGSKVGRIGILFNFGTFKYRISRPFGDSVDPEIGRIATFPNMIIATRTSRVQQLDGYSHARIITIRTILEPRGMPMASKFDKNELFHNKRSIIL